MQKIWHQKLSKSQISSFEFRVSSFKFQVSSFEFRVPGQRGLGVGLWSGLKTQRRKTKAPARLTNLGRPGPETFESRDQLET